MRVRPPAQVRKALRYATDDFMYYIDRMDQAATERDQVQKNMRRGSDGRLYMTLYYFYKCEHLLVRFSGHDNVVYDVELERSGLVNMTTYQFSVLPVRVAWPRGTVAS